MASWYRISGTSSKFEFSDAHFYLEIFLAIFFCVEFIVRLWSVTADAKYKARGGETLKKDEDQFLPVFNFTSSNLLDVLRTDLGKAIARGSLRPTLSIAS